MTDDGVERLSSDLASRLLVAPALTLPAAILLWWNDFLDTFQSVMLAVSPIVILSGGIVVFGIVLRTRATSR